MCASSLTVVLQRDLRRIRATTYIIIQYNYVDPCIIIITEAFVWFQNKFLFIRIHPSACGYILIQAGIAYVTSRGTSPPYWLII